MTSRVERLKKQLEINKAKTKTVQDRLNLIRREQISKERKEAHRKRNHAMFQSAGLLVLAGIVDGKTGILLVDRGALLGCLLEMAAVLTDTDSDRYTAWKAAGDDLLDASKPAPADKASKSEDGDSNEEIDLVVMEETGQIATQETEQATNEKPADDDLVITDKMIAELNSLAESQLSQPSRRGKR